MKLTRMNYQRSDRIKYVLSIIQKKGSVKIESLIGELAIQLGIASRLSKDYLKMLKDANHIRIEDGIIYPVVEDVFGVSLEPHAKTEKEEVKALLEKMKGDPIEPQKKENNTPKDELDE